MDVVETPVAAANVEFSEQTRRAARVGDAKIKIHVSVCSHAPEQSVRLMPSRSSQAFECPVVPCPRSAEVAWRIVRTLPLGPQEKPRSARLGANAKRDSKPGIIVDIAPEDTWRDSVPF